MQSLKKIHAWAQMKVPLWASSSGGMLFKEFSSFSPGGHFVIFALIQHHQRHSKSAI